MKNFEKYFPFFLIVGILLNANGLFIDILEPDGALYATIAKHIALTSDWMNLFGDGHDWLDKPHFPFWMSALSFKIFGITAFAYKLPAFIFWLTGIWFTYKLTYDLYDRLTAKVAVIIYIFALHGILNNFDVRAEPYLTALIISGIYYIYKASASNKWSCIVFAALTSACAVMTKGIFALISIGSGFVIYWILTKQWKQFVNYRWWALLLLIFIFILPELYSLYTQFDLHPEKVVFGKTHVSGLKFFFWDSQFGRFFNTGPIKGHGDKTFFLHTTLWAFLPFSIILYIAVFNVIKNSSAQRSNKIRWIIYGSALITFLLFSFSGFQLPHYIVILFPHFSIITAAYVSGIKKEATFKKLTVLQKVLLILSATAVSLLAFYSKMGNVVLIATVAVALVVAAFVYFEKTGLNTLIGISAGICVVLFWYLLNFFYPRIMQYQAGMMAGKYLTKNKFKGTTGLYNAWSYSFEFYAPGFVQYVMNDTILNNCLQKDRTVALYTSANTLDELRRKGYQFEVLQQLPFFHISMLTGPFLNPASRDAQVEQMALILVRRKLYPADVVK